MNEFTNAFGLLYDSSHVDNFNVFCHNFQSPVNFHFAADTAYRYNTRENIYFAVGRLVIFAKRPGYENLIAGRLKRNPEKRKRVDDGIFHGWVAHGRGDPAGVKRAPEAIAGDRVLHHLRFCKNFCKNSGIWIWTLLLLPEVASHSGPLPVLVGSGGYNPSFILITG